MVSMSVVVQPPGWSRDLLRFSDAWSWIFPAVPLCKNWRMIFSKFCSRSPVLPCLGFSRFALSAYSHDDCLLRLTQVSQGEPRLHFNLSLMWVSQRHVDGAAYFRMRHGPQEVGGLFRLPTFPLSPSLVSVRILTMIVSCVSWFISWCIPRLITL